jgi:hypothetical protein
MTEILTMSELVTKETTNAYLIHCSNCNAAVIISSPKASYDIILIEPCPMCNGLEQSFSCDYCFHRNTVYWDKRHFVSKHSNK